MLGSRAEAHPYVVAAREAEASLRVRLNSEVAVAIRGLQVEIELSADREKSLAAKYDAARSRMSRLAESRAEYSNLVASVQNHTRLVEAARKNLADARARQAGARSGSVISHIDGVEAGVWPSGPTRKTITAAGGVGGLLLGFGFVFLFATPVSVSRNSVSGSPVVIEAQVATPSPAVSDNIGINDLVSPVHADVSSTAQVDHTLAVNPARTSSEAFGMFRGMTLQEAIRSMKNRG